MLNPFVAVLKWYNRGVENKTRLTSQQNFNRGYDWAMNQMVLRTLTYKEVYMMARDRNDDYHMGALRAVSIFREVELLAAQKIDAIDKVIQHTS